MRSDSKEFRDSFKQSFSVYQKYQMAIHKDPPNECEVLQVRARASTFCKHFLRFVALLHLNLNKGSRKVWKASRELNEILALISWKGFKDFPSLIWKSIKTLGNPRFHENPGVESHHHSIKRVHQAIRLSRFYATLVTLST